jgi:C1A family cysteine protease
MIFSKITALLALISAILAFEDITKNNPSAIDLILSSLADKPKKDLFKAYHFLFKKEYDLNSEEALLRYRTFKQNINLIKETNNQNLSYKLGVNQFADMTNEEFRAKMLMKPQAFKAAKTRFLESAHIDFETMADDEDQENAIGQTIYAAIDWKVHFNTVMDQGNCGSCWAFTASTVMEGNYNKKYNKLLTFSPQQLVDCDTRGYGCDGGLPNLTFKSYARTTGLATLNNYPYTGTKGECKVVDTADQIGKVISYQYCTNDRYEGEIVKACTKDIYYKLLAQGPVALGMDAGSRTLQFYRSGVLVFKTTDCLEANHAVTGVGYFNNPTDGEGVIVRNSWGTSWGEAGNFRVRYDAGNKETCFLTNSIYVPNMQ